MLKIENCHTQVAGKDIVKGLDLTVGAGEVHAIMGPNGSGKSSLSATIMGRPGYDVTQGSISFMGQDILALEPEERARLGMFLGFQYPVEIPGVNNAYFLRTAVNQQRIAQGLAEYDAMDFLEVVQSQLSVLNMDEVFLERSLNAGFSGGEKKRNEILQMLMLQPRLAILDETDSGLDVDALQIVARGVNSMRSSENAIVLITHYQRLLDYIEPDFVHVLVDGKIVNSGDKSLALQLDKEGYVNVGGE